MATITKSIIENDGNGLVVDVQCHLSSGLPIIIIVGFTGKAINEAKERIRSAFASSKLQLPRKRITINLAPADIPKEGTGFDLAIATAILQASGQCAKTIGPKDALLGELGLDGRVRPIRGIIGKILAGKKLGIENFYIPLHNLSQARLIPDVKLLPVETLKDIAGYLGGIEKLSTFATGRGSLAQQRRLQNKEAIDMQQISGQPRAKRALEIAAAGHHNIILNGPPGTGKSMLAKALPTILPDLSIREILEISHLHSLANKNYDQIVVERPFRAPHHSSSSISIIGGGQTPQPGEISLSHRGVLFFDEIPEFSRSTLEALRQPLEDGVITVARAKDTIRFPAQFVLVGTANPCPCGHYGSNKACICLPMQILKYNKKLSGPILDRIDLFVTVDEVAHSKLLDKSSSGETSNAIKQRVSSAWKRQHIRQRKLNSELTSEQIKNSVALSKAARGLFNEAAKRLQLSPRAYMRSIKVARTIADLDSSDLIEVPHISEALQYRRPPQSINTL